MGATMRFAWYAKVRPEIPPSPFDPTFPKAKTLCHPVTVTFSNSARLSFVVGTESWASFFPPLLPGRGVRVPPPPPPPPPLLGECFLGYFPLPLAAARSARIRDASACSRTCVFERWSVRHPCRASVSTEAPSCGPKSSPFHTTSPRERVRSLFGEIHVYCPEVFACCTFWPFDLILQHPVQFRIDRSTLWTRLNQ